MKPLTLGIDAGKYTGLAIFEKGKLKDLYSLNTYQTITFLQNNKNLINKVIIEDSSAQSYIWNKNNKTNSALGRHARNIGSVDGKVNVFKEACEDLKIELIPISPLKKGKKWSKEDFKFHFPDFTKKSTTNQHERDAAKCVFCLNYQYENQV